MKKILQWIENHKITIVVALLLLIIDIVLAYLDNWKIKENYIPGSITEIIGIIITVTFVDLIFNQHSEKIEKELERRKIIRICRIIDLYLSRYIMYFDQLTNHPNSILDCKVIEIGNAKGSLIHDGNCEIAMNTNQNLFSNQTIEINYVNFSCLYESSRVFVSGGFRANIDCFYYYEKKILETFNRLLTEVDFKYYKNFEKLVVCFIDNSIKNDISDFIEYNRNIVCGSGNDKKLKIQVDATILASRNFNENKDYSDSRNDMMPYRMLKDLLNNERKILNEYVLLVKELII
jgi:hypothetical protein